MQHNTTTARTVERIQHSIKLIKMRLDANAHLIMPTENSCLDQVSIADPKRKKEMDIVVRECKAAISKLECILDISHRLDNDKVVYLLEKYHQMSIEAIKNTTSYDNPPELSTTQSTAT